MEALWYDHAQNEVNARAVNVCACVQNPEAAGGRLRVDVEKAVVARERSV